MFAVVGEFGRPARLRIWFLFTGSASSSLASRMKRLSLVSILLREEYLISLPAKKLKKEIQCFGYKAVGRKSKASDSTILKWGIVYQDDTDISEEVKFEYCEGKNIARITDAG
jgi:hypothetical protein